jgi:hypothetical protein
MCDDYLRLGKNNGTKENTRVDVECRTKMVEWCFQVVDFCECDRESVCIAMSYLDRFLCTDVGRLVLQDRKQFQLASMCCLYTAIKLFETREMGLDILSDLSRGCYTQTDIAKMERTLLGALQWRMHPPTPMNFVQYLHMLLPPEKVSDDIKLAVEDICRIQCVLAIKEYSFVTCKPSLIANAVVLNALDMIGHSDLFVPTKNVYIEMIADVSYDSSNLHQVRQILNKCVDNATDVEKEKIQEALKSISVRHVNTKIQRSLSPVCVSRKTQAYTGQ